MESKQPFPLSQTVDFGGGLSNSVSASAWYLLTNLNVSLRREPGLERAEDFADEEEAIQCGTDRRGAEAGRSSG